MKEAYEELCASANENPYSITHRSFAGKCCFDLPSSLGGCRCDQFYYNFIAGQWLPRQLMEMKENSRCSILFHLLVPGGKWLTDISIQRASANSNLNWSSYFATGPKSRVR